jgi:hypothetical protein
MFYECFFSCFVHHPPLCPVPETCMIFKSMIQYIKQEHKNSEHILLEMRIIEIFHYI